MRKCANRTGVLAAAIAITALGCSQPSEYEPSNEGAQLAIDHVTVSAAGETYEPPAATFQPTPALPPQSPALPAEPVVASPPGVFVGENLLKSAGFEEHNDLLTNWAPQWGVQSEAIRVVPDDNAPDGEYCLEVQAVSTQDFSIRQIVEGVEPGAKYQLSGYVKTDNVAIGAFFDVLDPRELDYAKSLISRTEMVQGSNDWRQLKEEFTVPENCFRIGFGLRHAGQSDGQAQSGRVYFDSCALRKVE